MGTVFEFIKAILIMIVTLALIGGLFYALWRWIVQSDLKWIIRYKILRQSYKEEDVEWCFDAVERGMTEIDIKKFLLLKGTEDKKIRELAFIFKQLNKKMKGGDAKNGKARS
jgi:hypothetical protein